MPRDLAALAGFLARTPFFAGLEERALRRVVEMTHERDFPAGGTVFREGDQGASMYVVESGELIAVRNAGSGRAVKLMRLTAGDFFGETTLIEMQPRPFSVTAERDARLLELTNADLYRLYREDVKSYVLVLQNINRELCRRLRRASVRITAYAADAGDEVTQITGRSDGS
ncbi:MAG TPA: cyclic nucleotide-binding domain-containing protein [Myxococcales bacterium]|nr:cyclic nucleotide-binding domain-containing protein [Myxococcales bacterium]